MYSLDSNALRLTCPLNMYTKQTKRTVFPTQKHATASSAGVETEGEGCRVVKSSRKLERTSAGSSSRALNHRDEPVLFPSSFHEDLTTIQPLPSVSSPPCTLG